MIHAKRLLLDEKTPPSLLYDAVKKEIGTAWLKWEPEVIWDEIEEEIGKDIPRINKEKIMALKLCINTTVPWEDWHPFTICVLAFNNVPFDADLGQEVSPSHLAYGVRVMKELQPDHEFKRDVEFIIASNLISTGIAWLPAEPLGEIVNEAIAYLVDAMNGDLSSIMKAKSDYINDKPLDEDSIHLTRLKAIEQYLEFKEALEEEMAK